MSFERITISIPNTLEEWVQSAVKAGGYRCASDYIQDLIFQDQELCAEQERLMRLFDGKQDDGFVAQSQLAAIAGVEERLIRDGKFPVTNRGSARTQTSGKDVVLWEYERNQNKSDF